MLHWSLVFVLSIYSCSLAVIFFACWQLYFYFFVPMWLVFVILIISVTGMILIALCWFYYYWDYQDIFKDYHEETGSVPLSEFHLNTTSDIPLVSISPHSGQNGNNMS